MTNFLARAWVGFSAALVLLPVAQANADGLVTNYGADPTGVANSTSAFQSCLNANTVCEVPAGVYIVRNLTLNDGNKLFGNAAVEYGTANLSNAAVRPILTRGSSSATNIINAASVARGGAIEGLMIDCASSSTNGISAGSYQLTVRDLTIVNCGAGIGATTYATSKELHVINSTFGNNVFGITNIIDSFIVNSDFANNSSDGLLIGGGSNANTITNSRFEWNGGFGINFNGGNSNNSVSTSLFDSNFKGGVSIVGVNSLTLSNSSFFRNGRINGTTQDYSQIHISGSKNVAIIGGTSLVGQDDGSVGIYRPKHIISFGSTASQNISLIGMATGGLFNETTNPSGAYTLSAIVGSPPVVGYNVVGTNDIPASVASGIAAGSGATRGNSTALTAYFNEVTTVAAANRGVKLLPCVVGTRQTVRNSGAYAIRVFTNVAAEKFPGAVEYVTHQPATTADYTCVGAGAWGRVLFE